MDAMKMAGFAVCAALVLLVLRQLRPEIGTVAAVASGAAVLLLALPYLRQILDGILLLASQGGVQQGYVSALLKVTGISLLMDFSAQTCRDAGENGLALKAELAGRVMMLALALPAMEALLRQILSLAS